MRDEAVVVVLLGQFDGVQRLGQRPDLIELDED
jgi:hypothetical protein